jgi:hypothetical protein
VIKALIGVIDHRTAVPRSRDTNKTPTVDPHLVQTNKASITLRGAEGRDALQIKRATCCASATRAPRNSFPSKTNIGENS